MRAAILAGSLIIAMAIAGKKPDTVLMVCLCVLGAIFSLLDTIEFINRRK